MKKIVLTILSVAALAAASFGGQGAQLVLTTKEGQVISGELLAVKHHCLVLKDASGAGFTRDIDDLAIISVRRGSHLLAGLGIGLAVGTAMGAGIGYASGQDYDPKSGLFGYGLYLFRGRATTAMAGAILGALAGAAAGAVIGSSTSASKMIKLADLSPEQVEKAIVWLRSKARFPEESY